MRILLAEDDASVGDTLHDRPQATGHAVTAAADVAAAAVLLARSRWNVRLTDLALPGGSGLDLAGLARTHEMGTVVCAGHLDRADRLGEAGVIPLVKPFATRELKRARDAAGSIAA